MEDQNPGLEPGQCEQQQWSQGADGESMKAQKRFVWFKFSVFCSDMNINGAFHLTLSATSSVYSVATGKAKEAF